MRLGKREREELKRSEAKRAIRQQRIADSPDHGYHIRGMFDNTTPISSGKVKWGLQGGRKMHQPINRKRCIL